jgi:hypothetical protein
VASIDALELGLIGSSLGAGRVKAGDQISYEVGFKLLKKPGDNVEMSKWLIILMLLLIDYCDLLIDSRWAMAWGLPQFGRVWRSICSTTHRCYRS